MDTQKEKGNTVQFEVDAKDDTFSTSRYWDMCAELYDRCSHNGDGSGKFVVTIEFYSTDKEQETYDYNERVTWGDGTIVGTVSNMWIHSATGEPMLDVYYTYYHRHYTRTMAASMFRKVQND